MKTEYDTGFGPFCRKKRTYPHLLICCRSKAHDDEIRRQQTRNIQERRTVFIHDYSKRYRPIFESKNLHTFNQQTRYGNQNNQKPHYKTVTTQIGTAIQFQIDNINQTNQATLGLTDQITVSRLNVTSMPHKRILIANTGGTFHNTTIYLHPIQSISSMTMMQIL